MVAPQQRKAKQCKILILNENQDFLFLLKTQKSAVHDRLWGSPAKPGFRITRKTLRGGNLSFIKFTDAANPVQKAF